MTELPPITGGTFGWILEQPSEPPTFLSLINRLLLEVDRHVDDGGLDPKHPVSIAAGAVKEALLTGAAFKTQSNQE